MQETDQLAREGAEVGEEEMRDDGQQLQFDSRYRILIAISVS